MREGRGEFVEARRFEQFKGEVARQVDAYLAQDPRPDIDTLVDFFAVHDLVHTDRRRAAKVVHIPALKEAVAKRQWETMRGALEADAGALVFPEYVPEVITPPGEGEVITGSDAGMEARGIIPRTRYLVNFLNANGIAWEAPFVGQNRDGMMRGTQSYFFFYLPELQIGINVNNREKEATFVFYGVPDRAAVQEKLLGVKKQEYKDSTINPYLFRRVLWRGDEASWQKAMHKAINTPIAVSVEEERGEEEGISIEEVKSRVRAALISVRSLDDAVKLFTFAHELWRLLPQKGRPKFTRGFLKSIGLNRVVNAARRFTPGKTIAELCAHAPDAVQADFVVQEKKPWTDERILMGLEAARKAWEASDDPTFNMHWMLLHNRTGFQNLFSAVRAKYGSVAAFLKTHGTDALREAFTPPKEKPVYVFQDRLIQITDEESAGKMLALAHEIWSEQDPKTRLPFTKQWLRKNGFGFVHHWVEKYGDFDRLVATATGNIREDFVVVKPVEEANIVDGLQILYRQWCALPEQNRPPFNKTFIRERGGEGPYVWMWRHGGVHAFVEKISPEALAVFDRDSRST